MKNGLRLFWILCCWFSFPLTLKSSEMNHEDLAVDFLCLKLRLFLKLLLQRLDLFSSDAQRKFLSCRSRPAVTPPRSPHYLSSDEEEESGGRTGTFGLAGFPLKCQRMELRGRGDAGRIRPCNFCWVESKLGSALKKGSKFLCSFAPRLCLLVCLSKTEREKMKVSFFCFISSATQNWNGTSEADLKRFLLWFPQNVKIVLRSVLMQPLTGEWAEPALGPFLSPVRGLMTALWYRWVFVTEEEQKRRPAWKQELSVVLAEVHDVKNAEDSSHSHGNLEVSLNEIRRTDIIICVCKVLKDKIKFA